MAAEFDTQPNYNGEEEQQPERSREGNGRGLWGTLALIVLAGVIILLLLAQCTARVPDVVGLNRREAEATLSKAGFPAGDVSEVPTGTVSPGYVNEQYPVAGATVRRGSTVDLMVVQGDHLVRVPDVIGQNAASAAIEVQQAGFDPDSAEEYSDLVPRGRVVEQYPRAGSLADPGSKVTFYYSLGPHSDATVAYLPTDTNDGLTDATRDSTGTGTSAANTCTRAYPGAAAWSSGGDIYVRLTPGGAARRVTSTSDWDTDPVVAPSHKYLVFLRAPGPGQHATAVGAVCFTTFATRMMPTLPVSLSHNSNYWYSKPVFAPSPSSTAPSTDWIVYAQHFTEQYKGGPVTQSARLIVCNVPLNSAWVSWNDQFRPAQTLTISRSNRPGSVHVRQTSGSKVLYNRDFQISTGLYLR